MKLRQIWISFVVAASLAPSASRLAAQDWPVYGADAGGARWSETAQIDRRNVTSLDVAWTFSTGELAEMKESKWRNATLEVTPILVEGRLYVCSGLGRVFALDPTTGRETWRFDAKIDLSIGRTELTCRGVSSWIDPDAAPGAECRHRIFFATVDGALFALDGATGKPCGGFGETGRVDLTAGIGTVVPGRYGVTSPPAIVRGVAVVGSAIGDNQRADEASGAVRAYDLRTGKLRWTWDPVPRDASDPAWPTWHDGSAAKTGAANAWSILSADEERDLVFVPTGSASPDFYGGARPGENRYANSLVALRASTGKMVWHFQVVHHDLWDYDVPAQPVLFTLQRDGRDIPAVAQATKMGHVFVFHRETGEPLFPIEERPVPKSDVPGEWTSPTQPFPVKPVPLVPQTLAPEDAWGLTPWDRSKCRERIAALRSGPIFTPPSEQGTIIFPGNAGGTNWGSMAVDPGRQKLFVNTSRVPTVVRVFPSERFADEKRLHPRSEVSPQTGTAYGMRREFTELLSPLGIPCNPPPWGTIAAIDLRDGSIGWESTLGTTRDLSPVPIGISWGTPNMGGPIATAGGLVFIAAAMDNYLRAFDSDTGAELWKGRLPAGGQATPMTYSVGGKQFVVVAAGGHQRLSTKLGDTLVAFALP